MDRQALDLVGRIPSYEWLGSRAHHLKSTRHARTVGSQLGAMTYPDPQSPPRKTKRKQGSFWEQGGRHTMAAMGSVSAAPISSVRQQPDQCPIREASCFLNVLLLSYSRTRLRFSEPAESVGSE